MENSVMIRQLALDRALRRKVVRERRRALRKASATEMIEERPSSRKLSFIIHDYGEEDWTTNEDDDQDGDGDEDEKKPRESAAIRESRLRVMKNQPKCADEDMAIRYKTLKQVNK